MDELIRTTLKKEKKDLLKRRGVTAVGIGIKVVDGKPTGYPCIVVSVERKVSPSELKSKDLIPNIVGAVLTDVVETGVIKALHTQKHRPAPGGVSIGHVDVSVGTLGCLVNRKDEVLILSNSHVLALSGQAEIGDPIIQPGSYDGGKYPEDHIADLVSYVPIQMSGLLSDCPFASSLKTALNLLAKLLRSRTRFQIIREQKEANLVDAAIARPLDPTSVISEIMEIGEIKGIKEAEIGQEIKKSGRTTGLTTGKIEQVDVTVNVQYGEGKIATFEDQIMAGKMCAGGDSGSAVLTDSNYLVGLLFAGSETTMIANRIQNVISAFDLEFE